MKNNKNPYEKYINNDKNHIKIGDSVTIKTSMYIPNIEIYQRILRNREVGTITKEITASGTVIGYEVEFIISPIRIERVVIPAFAVELVIIKKNNYYKII